MIDLFSRIGISMNTAVKVGNLFFPANSLAKSIDKFCEPGLFHNRDFEEYATTKSGSAFRARLDGRFVALLTAHQLRIPQYEYQQFCIANPERNSFTTSGLAVFSQGSDDEVDDLDIIAFDFTKPVRDGLLSDKYWYDLSGETGRIRTPAGRMVICIGFPGYLNQINYDSRHLEMTSTVIVGSETKTAIPGRLAFKPLASPPNDPQGMSGAPVFGITISEYGNRVFFAGILTNASTEIFHFLPLTRFVRKLRSALRMRAM